MPARWRRGTCRGSGTAPCGTWRSRGARRGSPACSGSGTRALRDEPLRVRPVDLEAIGLAIAGRGRALVPVEPEPAHGIDDLLDVGVGGARAVGIFDAEDEHTLVTARESPVEQRGARAAHVEGPGGAGGKANPYGLRHVRSFYSDATAWAHVDGSSSPPHRLRLAASPAVDAGWVVGCLRRAGWGFFPADHAEPQSAWPLQPATRFRFSASKNLPRRHGPAGKNPQPTRLSPWPWNSGTHNLGQLRQCVSCFVFGVLVLAAAWRVGLGASSLGPYLLGRFFEAENQHLVAGSEWPRGMRLSVVQGGSPQPRPSDSSKRAGLAQRAKSGSPARGRARGPRSARVA